MIKKIFLPILALAFAVPLTAQPINHDFEHPAPKFNKPFPKFPKKDLDLRFLNLTEEQNTKIREIKDEYRKKSDLIMLELERNKLDFDEAMITENYDFNKLKELIENRKKLESDVLISFLERDLKVKDLLTEQQWKVFKKSFPKDVNFCNKENKCSKDKRFKDKHNKKPPQHNNHQKRFKD